MCPRRGPDFTQRGGPQPTGSLSTEADRSIRARFVACGARVGELRCVPRETAKGSRQATTSVCDVSFLDVNAVELFILGRKLMKVAEDALPPGRTATSVRLVVADIAYHPGSSISEITERTGFPQSHVSASVAKLRDLGILETEIDPTDRRRTLVRMTQVAWERTKTVSSIPIEQVLAPVLGDPGSSEMAEVAEALELLAQKLTPEALDQHRSKVAS